MALAKKFNRAVTEIVPETTKVTQVPHIELNLTISEARTLRKVCARIGGCGIGREDMVSILNALDAASVEPADLETTSVDRAIYFR